MPRWTATLVGLTIALSFFVAGTATAVTPTNGVYQGTRNSVPGPHDEYEGYIRAKGSGTNRKIVPPGDFTCGGSPCSVPNILVPSDGTCNALNANLEAASIPIVAGAFDYTGRANIGMGGARMKIRLQGRLVDAHADQGFHADLEHQLRQRQRALDDGHASSVVGPSTGSSAPGSTVAATLPVVSDLRVGIQLPEVERDVRWPEYLAMARTAEAVGFDSIWVGDHYLYRDDGRPERGPWEAWTLLAALAAVTERVRLGPLVACLNFHEPAVLAKLAATVDEVSAGRLVFGMGAGWNRTEFDAFGIPYDHRASRFEEAFDIVRRLLAGERVTVRGRWHTVDDAVLMPAPSNRATLMVGSSGERVLAATLPYVDAWNTWFDWYSNTAEGFAARTAQIDAACERADRDPSTLVRSACVLVQLGDVGAERPAAPDVTPLRGSLDEIAHGMRAMADAGADEVIVVCDPITEPSIARLGEMLSILRPSGS